MLDASVVADVVAADVVAADVVAADVVAAAAVTAASVSLIVGKVVRFFGSTYYRVDQL